MKFCLVNIVFNIKEKAFCHYVDFIVKVFEEIPKLPREEYRMPITVSKSGVCLDQNWMFMDRREEGLGFQKLQHFFCEHYN